MRKTLSLLAALFAVLAFYSCKDIDDSANPYTYYATITVDSADVFFPAAPSTGSIIVTAPGGITHVTSSASWCTAAIDGNAVKLAATQNDNLEERASQITIWSGSDSTKVTVRQMGFILQLETGNADNSVVTGDGAGARSFYMKHNTEINVSTAVDWVTPSVTGDSLVLTLTENATGNPRETYVYYSSGSLKDSILVTQFEVAKDMLGDYDLTYLNSKSEWTSLPVTVYEKENAKGTYAIKFTSGSYARNGLEIPVVIDNDYPRFTISNLDSVGMYTYKEVDYHVMLLLLYSNGASYYRTKSAYKAVGTWAQEDGVNSYPFDMSESVGSNYFYYGLRLALSTDGTYDKISLTLLNLFFAELERQSASGAKKQVPLRMRTR